MMQEQANLEAKVSQLESRLTEERESVSAANEARESLAIQNAVVQSDLDSTRQALGKVEGELDNIQQQLAAEKEATEDLRSRLEDSDSEVDGLAASVNKLNKELETATTQSASIQEDLAQVKAELSAAETKYNNLVATQGDQQSINRELAALRSEIAEKRSDIDSLKTEAQNLQAKIDELKDEIEKYGDVLWTRPLTCSGSMLPRISCTDKAIVRTDVPVEDIQKGHAIIFVPPDDEDCRFPPKGMILHRVVEKSQLAGVRRPSGEFGLYLFLTKGDNNDSSDGCWIPETNVLGVVAAVEEDLYPELKSVEDRVSQATSHYESELGAYNSLEESIISNFDQWLNIVKRCYRVVVDGVPIYYCRSILDVNQANELRDQILSAIDRLDGYWQDVQEAWDELTDTLRWADREVVNYHKTKGG